MGDAPPDRILLHEVSPHPKFSPILGGVWGPYCSPYPAPPHRAAPTLERGPHISPQSPVGDPIKHGGQPQSTAPHRDVSWGFHIPYKSFLMCLKFGDGVTFTPCCVHRGGPMGFRVHGSTWGAHITPPHLTGVLPFQKTMILIVFPNP